MTAVRNFFGHSGSIVLLIIIAMCVGIEGLLTLSDHNWIGISNLRGIAYFYGGFWLGLLGNWQPNFALQPYTMFITYAFLHAGFWHLLFNMITLWSLGQAIIAEVGTWRFCVIYGASILGGGLGFGLLSSAGATMIGASGALFGLVGAWLAWDALIRIAQKDTLMPVFWSLFGLVLLNVGLWWITNGHLAWETHLGGGIAGLLVGALIHQHQPQPE